MAKSLQIIVIALLPSILIAQNQANHWFFGKYAGIDFSSGTPESISGGKIFSYEGCASISGISGNLLFYTNGGGRDSVCAFGQANGKIFTSTHQVMENGYMTGSEGGGWSAAQSSIILPKPGTANQYYIFTIEEKEYPIGICPENQDSNQQGGGLSYFVVDMNQNNGNGAVVEFNKKLLTPAYEGLSATIHANGIHYWLIASDTNQNSILFRITEGGIDTVLSHAGSGHPSGFNYYKFSPNSKYLFTEGAIYEFNNMTGAITNRQNIPQSKYGSFSPNSNYFYTIHNERLIQYNVLESNIAASRYIINDSVEFGQLQLAPDGKIYISGGINNPWLHTISCPNDKGSKCNFERQALQLSTGECLFGLPNFPDYWFRFNNTCNEENIRADFYYTCTCINSNIHFYNTSFGNPDSCLWNFGDTASGIADFSNEIHPSHSYNKAGTYPVSLKIFKNGYSDSVTYLIDVEECPPADFIYSNPCTNDTTYFFMDVSPCIDSLLWFINDPVEGLIPFSGAAMADYVFSTPGAHEIVVIIYSGTADTLLKEVQIHNPPLAEAGTDTIISRGTNIELNTTSCEHELVSWESEGNQVTVDDKNHTWVAPQQTTSYILNVTDTNTTCSKNDTFTVKVNEIPIKIYNAFTPNGDGINDTWHIENIENYPDNSVEVYNRSGNLVYKAKGYHHAEWDGNYTDNKKVPGGAYYYIISIGKNYRSIHGEITVLR